MKDGQVTNVKSIFFFCFEGATELFSSQTLLILLSFDSTIKI